MTCLEFVVDKIFRKPYEPISEAPLPLVPTCALYATDVLNSLEGWSDSCLQVINKANPFGASN